MSQLSAYLTSLLLALLLLLLLPCSTMKPKNGLAFKSLINVSLAVGNHLGERWVACVGCTPVCCCQPP